MRVAEANQPMGSRYNVEFGKWLARTGFDDMDSGDRRRLFEVVEHRAGIEAWRATLASNVRLKFNHPSTVLRKWRASAAAPGKKPAKSKASATSTELATALEQVDQLKAHVHELEAAREVAPAEDAPGLSGDRLAALFMTVWNAAIDEGEDLSLDPKEAKARKSALTTFRTAYVNLSELLEKQRGPKAKTKAKGVAAKGKQYARTVAAEMITDMVNNLSKPAK